MGHLSYEDSKSRALKIISILAIMTITEVLIALAMKGHILGGALVGPGWLLALIMVTMSIVKAYLIIYEFMHMKYEVSGLVKSVLLPTLLLVWAVIAFFWEGADWNKRRTLIKELNERSVNEKPVKKTTGEAIRKLDASDIKKG